MNETEVKRIVAEAVAETLVRLGIDPHDAGGTQRDMHYLRNLRTSTDAVKRQGFITATVIIVTAAAGLLWMAVKGGPPAS